MENRKNRTYRVNNTLLHEQSYEEVSSFKYWVSLVSRNSDVTVDIKPSSNQLSHTAAKFGQLLTELLLSPWLGKGKYCLIYMKMEFGKLEPVWNHKICTRTLILYRIFKLEDWSGWTTWLEWRISDYQRRFWTPSWIKSKKLVDLNKDGLMVSKLI